MSLPDLSKWNLNQLSCAIRMFMGCKSLISLPNFKFNNDISDFEMTNGCVNLVNPPENLDTSYNNSELLTESTDLDQSKSESSEENN